MLPNICIFAMAVNKNSIRCGKQQGANIFILFLNVISIADIIKENGLEIGINSWGVKNNREIKKHQLATSRQTK